MRNILTLLLFTVLVGLFPGQALCAQDSQASDVQAVMDRANHLKSLLDRLLTQSNHSSIRMALNEGGDDSDPLMEEALALKARGERFLADEDYLQAAMTLQAALDQVFQVIRSKDNGTADGKEPSARLAEAIAVNDTFTSAATRVVNGESKEEAADLLAQAREARARADTSAANGDPDAALQELEQSTQLAQQAIMSMRNGMVIERSQ